MTTTPIAKTPYNPIIIVTPEVTLEWAYLTTPDEGNAKFPKDVPEYQTKFHMPDDEAAQAMVKVLAAHADAAYKKALEEAALEGRTAGKPAKRVKKADLPVFETEAGFSGKAKQKAWIMSKKGARIDKAPTLVDAKVKPWDKSIPIYSGARAILQLEVVPYNSPIGCGVSLRLQAVQILSLSERQTSPSQQSTPVVFRSQEEEDEAPDAPIAFTAMGGTQANGDF